MPTRRGLREWPPQERPKRLVNRGSPGTVDAMHLDRITVDPNRMGGVPCIRDLRVTVAIVLGQLAAGLSREDLLDEYPYL